MRGSGAGSDRTATVKWLLWTGLLVSWVILLPMMWQAFTTVPTPARLAQPRMIGIPTLQTVELLVGQSLVELGVALGLAAPWWRRRYLTRLWLGAVALWVWFIASTPIGLTRLAWVHRRWLAMMAAAFLVAAVIGSAARVVRGLAR